MYLKERNGFITAAIIDGKSRFKGQKVGGAVVSEKHAGFIVNTGKCNSKRCDRLNRNYKSNSKRKIQRKN